MIGSFWKNDKCHWAYLNSINMRQSNYPHRALYTRMQPLTLPGQARGFQSKKNVLTFCCVLEDVEK
jgi:hypothetical protein